LQGSGLTGGGASLKGAPPRAFLGLKTVEPKFLTNLSLILTRAKGTMEKGRDYGVCQNTVPIAGDKIVG
jgi:hypothetical protein